MINFDEYTNVNKKEHNPNWPYISDKRISNERELQQIAINHSSDINTKDFIEIYRKYSDKPYSF